MKNQIYSRFLCLCLVFLSVFTNAQEIKFEGTVEQDVMYDGLSYLVINITDGPLKGKKETAYFKTNMTDEFNSTNFTQLGMGMPIDMQLEGTEFKFIKVSGTLLKTNANFEDPQTGAVKSMSVLRIKELKQIEPFINTDMASFPDETQIIESILNGWLGTYKNSQGHILTVSRTNLTVDPNQAILFYSLKLVGRKGTCYGYTAKNGSFIKEANVYFDAEKTLSITNEIPGVGSGDELLKTANGITFSPETHFGMECLDGIDYEFKKIN
jgi:hypothetical protein